MGRVNLCWTCLRCGADNKVSMDPWEEETEINWAPDAEFWDKCAKCGAEHEAALRVVTSLANKP